MSAKLGEIIMADERNIHVKMAMAEVFGLYMIAFVGILVGSYGLKVFDGLGVIINVAMYLGIGLLVCMFIAFLNENLLLTGIFGILGIFLVSFEAMLGGGDATSAMVYMAAVGVFLLVMALVSMMQPVKILPVLLIVAGLAFIFLGMWYSDLTQGNGENLRMIVGVLWILVGLLATYMAAAITMLVMKGKPVLPLLISK